jgi:intracellular sulfur oxidation DsrE/DsrF family protein
LFHAAFAQPVSDLQKAKDSTLRARYKADSMAVDKEFKDKEDMERIGKIAQFPVINAGPFSGVVPVLNPTEVPDPNQDYKLLFELTANNPDSLIKDPNSGLVEVARMINLHVASGVPLKRIFPVIVIHAGALNAISTNAYFNEHFKMDNPSLKVIGELEKLGAKFIACGQAMNFMHFKNEDMLPLVKISVTAQTVVTSYQLKGYVWLPR